MFSISSAFVCGMGQDSHLLVQRVSASWAEFVFFAKSGGFDTRDLILVDAWSHADGENSHDGVSLEATCTIRKRRVSE